MQFNNNINRKNHAKLTVLKKTNLEYFFYKAQSIKVGEKMIR